jgi:hypothetical protein
MGAELVPRDMTFLVFPICISEGESCEIVFACLVGSWGPADNCVGAAAYGVALHNKGVEQGPGYSRRTNCTVPWRIPGFGPVKRIGECALVWRVDGGGAVLRSSVTSEVRSKY